MSQLRKDEKSYWGSRVRCGVAIEGQDELFFGAEGRWFEMGRGFYGGRSHRDGEVSTQCLGGMCCEVKARGVPVFLLKDMTLN